MPCFCSVSSLDRSGSKLTAITLENDLLRLVLLPGAGAKIVSLVHLPTATELLWASPQVEAQAVTPGSSYDDTWAGGWDELFPNDEPAQMDGFALPDHGELWTCAWQFDVERSEHSVTLHLWTETPVTQCRVEKWIRLSEGSGAVHFKHALRNGGTRAVPYLWKLHPALRVQEGDRLFIPAREFVLEPLSPGTLEGGEVIAGTSQVRTGERTVDLLSVPSAESKEMYFFYGIDLQEGWCAWHRPSTRLALALAFPVDIFPHCWLFASYGAWRDYNVAVLEPCTGYPFKLEGIDAAGRGLRLQPGEAIEAEVTLTVEDGVRSITKVSPCGEIVQ